MADERIKTDEVPEAVQKLFDERHHRRISSSFRAARNTVINRAMLCGAVLMIVMYALMPVSRIRNISVHGNRYLGDVYIRTAADVSEKSIFFLNLPILIEHRLENDPLIESADVSLHSSNMLDISVTEKKILGYRYDTEPVLLMADGSQVPLKSEYLDLIARVPLISGFEGEELTRMLVKAFSNVSASAIAQMSEVSQYDMGYDTQSIRVLMRTGGYFLAGYNSLVYINNYNELYSQMADKSQCVIVEDGFKAAYTKTCPWDEPVREVEYWLDAEGNKIMNSSGLPAEKHYYGLSDGAMAHDAAGNRIVIPINLRGDDEPDEMFEAHYYAGYYETGKLVIPEDEEGEGEENPEEEAEPEE